MRTNFDFTPFRRSTVGFDRLFDLLEDGRGLNGGETFPPFDLEQRGDDGYRITLAVAGFGCDEIDITAQQNLLVVSGRKADERDRKLIHRGVATGAFERRFALGDYVQVKSADLRDGLLSIDLVREIPDEMKPRRIDIGSPSGQSRLSDQSGADSAANENEGRHVAA